MHLTGKSAFDAFVIILLKCEAPLPVHFFISLSHVGVGLLFKCIHLSAIIAFHDEQEKCAAVLFAKPITESSQRASYSQPTATPHISNKLSIQQRSY
jgi:hypothetical protein